MGDPVEQDLVGPVEQGLAAFGSGFFFASSCSGKKLSRPKGASRSARGGMGGLLY